jgi:hypothetical protein
LAADKTAAIRPFHVNVPEAEVTELRRRITRQGGLNGKQPQLFSEEVRAGFRQLRK